MSSAIKTPAFQAKAGNIQNEDGSSIYSGGEWSFKNASAVTGFHIASDGNVGIGTDSPAEKVTIVGGNLLLEDNSSSASEQGIYFTNFSTRSSYIKAIYGSSGAGNPTDLVFATNPASGDGVERMRIDANGDVTIQSPGKLLINNTFGSGNTGNYIIQTPVNGNSSCLTLAANGGTYYGMTIRGQNTSTYRALNFLSSTNGAVGRVECTTTATSYISGASDYRLKEEIAPLSGGLDKVCAMKPVSFKWKESQKEDYGFIAHELQAVIPEAISGEKDAVDAEGNPEYQAIFPAPAQMVASLVAAIQELSAKNDALEARLAALESK